MKSLFFTATWLFTTLSFSQKIPLDSLKVMATKICFEYDASGNRIRTYICNDTPTASNINPPHLNNNTKSMTSQTSNLDYSKGKIFYYPVPTRDYLVLEITDKDIVEEINAISIFDNTGKEIINQKNISNINKFDLTRIATGFVYIKISYTQEEVMYKIVKVD